MNLLRTIVHKLFGQSDSPTPTAVSDTETRSQNKYYKLPATRQYSPRSQIAVDKTNWKPCLSCGRKIPVVGDGFIDEHGHGVTLETWTAVCPFCGHCHVGTPDPSFLARQETCHECETPLGNLSQCSNCSFPGGWKRIDCPYCGKQHPVFMPHWVDYCDTFRLECVHCESVFISLCIC